MIDWELRAIARLAEQGDPEAAERLRGVEKRIGACANCRSTDQVTREGEYQYCSACWDSWEDHVITMWDAYYG